MTHADPPTGVPWARQAPIIDFIAGDTSNGRLDHICLVIDPVDLDAIADSGQFTVLDGPATLFGARGDGRSLYIRDPDGLTVELRHYPPDALTQP